MVSVVMGRAIASLSASSQEGWTILADNISPCKCVCVRLVEFIELKHRSYQERREHTNECTHFIVCSCVLTSVEMRLTHMGIGDVCVRAHVCARFRLIEKTSAKGSVRK